MAEALVIGSGPAGLMAAEALADGGLAVTVADSKPSFGRKFLMAGKSGLNLTMAEDTEAFLHKMHPSAPLAPMLRSFGPEEVQDFSRALGQEVFTGSSGRVFPLSMKASPLLRAWLNRLSSKGVRFETRWRWQGWEGRNTVIETQDGLRHLTPDVLVLALGGASWSRLGSDGAWVAHLQKIGARTLPFQPANMGFRVAWSSHMEKHFGRPLKPIALRAGPHSTTGECVISRRGLEGSAVYTVSRALREGAPLELDLAPGLDAAALAARLARPRGKASLNNHLRKAARLDPAKIALLREWSDRVPDDPAALAGRIKALPARLEGPRPLDEAISTAGGLSWDSLDENLMLREKAGVFCAGEMLDWEAPTGGYLISACLATGLWAGHRAAQWAQTHS